MRISASVGLIEIAFFKLLLVTLVVASAGDLRKTGVTPAPYISVIHFAKCAAVILDSYRCMLVAIHAVLQA